MRLRFVAVAATVGLFAVVVAGCGSSSSSSSGSSATTSGSSSAAKKYSIGIVDFSVTEPTSQGVLNSFEAGAKQKGWEITRINPEASAEKAIAAIQTLVQKKVNLIITAVFPSTELTGGVQAALAAKIPMLSVGGGTTEGVQTNWNAGKAAGGAAIAELMVKESGGKGNLLILGYKSGLPCIGREEALDEVIKSASYNRTRDEVPIPGQVAASTNFTQAWLAQHPSNGEAMTVWGCFDEPSLGAIAAAKEARRTGVRVYGFDGLPAGIKAIEEGDMNGEIWFNTKLGGEEIVKATPQYISEGVTKAPSNPPIPFELVTQQNVKEFVTKFPEASK